jgi:hypothetical protein
MVAEGMRTIAPGRESQPARCRDKLIARERPQGSTLASYHGRLVRQSGIGEM